MPSVVTVRRSLLRRGWRNRQPVFTHWVAYQGSEHILLFFFLFFFFRPEWFSFNYNLQGFFLPLALCIPAGKLCRNEKHWCSAQADTSLRLHICTYISLYILQLNAVLSLSLGSIFTLCVCVCVCVQRAEQTQNDGFQLTHPLSWHWRILPSPRCQL